MKFFFVSIVFLVAHNCSTILGQFNIQTGYDFGFFKTDYYYSNEFLSLKDDSHQIHRLNGKIEYQFKNNLLVSLNTGIDIHDFRHHLETKGDNVGASSFIQSKSFHHSKIQTYRFGLSIGYQHYLNNTSILFLSISYDQFFVNSVNINRSDYIRNRFLISEVENNNPYFTSIEHRAMIDLNEIGYRNKFKTDNRHIIFSLGYRYYKGSFFISPSLAITTKNKTPVRSFGAPPKPQNLFLFGVNLGYTLPQKNKNDEK